MDAGVAGNTPDVLRHVLGHQAPSRGGVLVAVSLTISAESKISNCELPESDFRGQIQNPLLSPDADPTFRLVSVCLGQNCAQAATLQRSLVPEASTSAPHLPENCSRNGYATQGLL